MLHSALLAAALAAGAFAAPQITSPAPGASLPGSGAITVEWKDDGEAPKISTLQSFTLQLVVGGNTDADSVCWDTLCLKRPLSCEMGMAMDGYGGCEARTGVCDMC